MITDNWNIIKIQKLTFLFLKQFKTIDTKTQIGSQLEIVGFAGKHAVSAVHFQQSHSTQYCRTLNPNCVGLVCSLRTRNIQPTMKTN